MLLGGSFSLCISIELGLSFSLEIRLEGKKEDPNTIFIEVVTGYTLIFSMEKVVSKVTDLLANAMF